MIDDNNKTPTVRASKIGVGAWLVFVCPVLLLVEFFLLAHGSFCVLVGVVRESAIHQSKTFFEHVIKAVQILLAWQGYRWDVGLSTLHSCLYFVLILSLAVAGE